MNEQLQVYRSIVLGAVLMATLGAISSTAHGAGGDMSIEYKLAVVHKGANVRADDPLVGRFRSTLNRLEGKCPESRRKLADMGVKGRHILHQRGVKDSLLSVFENWLASIPAGARDGDVGPCIDVLTAYITLRVGR